MATATSAGYGRYLTALHEYWHDFLKRTQPLMPLEAMLKQARADFEAKWAEGGVTRWQKGKPAEAEAKEVDLAKYEAAIDLEALGLDGLKVQLSLRGLKCGGTLKDRAERLFLLKTMSKEEIPKKHLAKAAEGGEAGGRGQRDAALQGVGAGAAGVRATARGVTRGERRARVLLGDAGRWLVGAAGAKGVRRSQRALHLSACRAPCRRSSSLHR